MKATDLGFVVRWFDPRRGLQGDQLNAWFVPRPNSPRGRIKQLLFTAGEPQKILLIGHRGSGKSTELNKLAEETKNQFQIVMINPVEVLGRGNLEYEDVMLAIGTQVTQYCIQHSVIDRPLSEPVRQGWKSVQSWWQRTVAGINFAEPKGSPELGIQLGTLLGQVEAGVKGSSLTRDEIKTQINRQMPELIGHLNWVIAQAQQSIDRQLLIIVEGLDKVDLGTSIAIFRDHAETITSLNCHMIYTFPLDLRRADDYSAVVRNFQGNFYLPNIPVRHADGSANSEGVEILSRLVLDRMEANLIIAEALDLLVHASGGIPVYLVSLVRSSALFALDRIDGASEIAVADANNAIRELRRELSKPLTSEDIAILRARHKDRMLVNDPIERRLLYNVSLIEYSNGETWCDAHPVLWSLLEAQDANNNTAGGAVSPL